MRKIIKVCGDQCNTNFNLEHTKKIITILANRFKEYEGYDIQLMEVIAGFSFAILGDFDCILAEEQSLEEDKKKTQDNIDKLFNYLYGGYHDLLEKGAEE